jgi:predicted metal-dependent hydrolase
MMFHVKQKGKTAEQDFILKRSRRKTVSLEIAPDGTLVVRGPLTYTNAKAEAFINAHRDWIEKHRPNIESKHTAFLQADMLPVKALNALAYGMTAHLVDKYSALIGVKPETLKITSAKKRFGSCSGKNGICFSRYLMLFPFPAIEYVVVHELCHILHHDHSKSFHNAVRSFLPSADEYERLLAPEHASYANIQENLEILRKTKDIPQ